MPEDPTAPANDENPPDSPVQQPAISQPSSPVRQPEIRQPSPFDFHGSMRRLGGNPTSMFSVVDQVDDRSDTNVHGVLKPFQVDKLL